VVHLVPDEDEKESWEQQFAESKAAILRELEREAAAREIQPRSTLELDLVVLTQEETDRGEAERVFAAVMEPEDVPPLLARLQEEREVVFPRRLRTLTIESEPPEAQVYVDHKPAGVTPCRVEDLPEGDHLLTFARPGYLPYEATYRIEPGRAGQKLKYRAELEAEPAMGVLEVKTFPPRARVTINGETRDTPARWRLPAGPVRVHVEMEEFEPVDLVEELPPSPEEHPHRLQLRLRYNGPEQDEVVGRLVIYKPGAAPPPSAPSDPAADRISSFFREAEEPGRGSDWDFPTTAPPPTPEPLQVLGERPLRRGVLLIGRDDPNGGLRPDIRLFDPENSVSRGCHAWLYVYADRSTGAAYNTFLIGNNSPAGIRVDGALVMETRRLAEDSEIEIGGFRMRLVKETPEARVEFGF
ncbi:MAG TPA: PEGA domain-containing protein, partial [Armatimonadota bacterium]|nr:PEGA domain-containing protein [Armatimonadota bacterium]